MTAAVARKKHIDQAAGAPAPDGAREVAAAEKAGEKAWQAALRPRTFDDYIGQRDLIDNLKVSVRAAKQNGWTLDHFLFAGPPGLGKTTLAHVIANELGVTLHVSSGPAIDHKGMLASLLTSLGEGDALFIDEIHRLAPIVEENLYPAMEDFRFDLFIGEGPHAKAVTMQLPLSEPLEVRLALAEIELAPTDGRIEADLRSLDHIVGLLLDDPNRLMN
jgi:Holliday junction DNA helicase RuvB